MPEPNPDTWPQSHMRWLALSKWDSEGGASPSRPTEGAAGSVLRHQVRPTAGPVPLFGPESSVPPTRRASFQPQDLGFAMCASERTRALCEA